MFKYKENEPDCPERIVVKRSSGSNSDERQKESEFLQHLSGSNSIHIIKLYVSYLAERGTGTHPNYDPPPPNVASSWVSKIRFRPTATGAKAISYNAWKEDAYPEVSRIYMEYYDLKNLDIHHYAIFG